MLQAANFCKKGCVNLAPAARDSWVAGATQLFVGILACGVRNSILVCSSADGRQADRHHLYLSLLRVRCSLDSQTIEEGMGDAFSLSLSLCLSRSLALSHTHTHTQTDTPLLSEALDARPVPVFRISYSTLQHWGSQRDRAAIGPYLCGNSIIYFLSALVKAQKLARVFCPKA